MSFQFTPAAQRALDTAALWTSTEADEALLPAALLLGLLAESESRAGTTLAAAAISHQQVQTQWHTLAQTADGSSYRARNWSPELAAAMSAAQELLDCYPKPFQWATEHLLLALTADASEVARWLADRGVQCDQLLNEIHQRNGYDPEPLEVDLSPTCKVNAEDDVDEYALSPDDGTEIPDLTELAPDYCPVPEVAWTPPESALTVGDELNVLRVLDAAANRAREGLRVVEDYVRFCLDDRHLTEQLKELRHEVAVALVMALPDRAARDASLASRDTLSDVGTSVSLATEQQRRGLAGIRAANFKRLQESLRSLEEYGKLVSSAAGAAFERIRYRSYTLERAVENTRAQSERLAAARLYVLLDGGPSPEVFEQTVIDLVAAGVHVLQLRDKRLADRELLARARQLRAITLGTDTLGIMNDRADLACLARLDGVHVGQDELTVREARAIVGPRALVGVSTHSLIQARQAVLAGASYLGVGPTFASTTKQFTEFPGLELIQQVSAEIRLPAFAIGGIHSGNLSQVLSAGATRIAVSSAVMNSPRPAEEVRALLDQLQNG